MKPVKMTLTTVQTEYSLAIIRYYDELNQRALENLRCDIEWEQSEDYARLEELKENAVDLTIALGEFRRLKRVGTVSWRSFALLHEASGGVLDLLEEQGYSFDEDDIDSLPEDIKDFWDLAGLLEDTLNDYWSDDKDSITVTA